VAGFAVGVSVNNGMPGCAGLSYAEQKTPAPVETLMSASPFSGMLECRTKKTCSQPPNFFLSEG